MMESIVLPLGAKFESVHENKEATRCSISASDSFLPAGILRFFANERAMFLLKVSFIFVSLAWDELIVSFSIFIACPIFNEEGMPLMA